MNWLKSLLAPRITIRAASVQHLGAEGPDVLVAQQRLNLYGSRYGIHVREDGHYGPEMQEAVQLFQAEALGLDSDGFIGPQTSRRLRLILDE